MHRSKRGLRLIGYIALGNPSDPGFGLPIFVSDLEPNNYLIQEVDEHLNTIMAFRPLQGSDGAFLPLVKGPIAAPGEKLVFVFVADDGSKYVGKLEEIESALKNFQKRRPD